VILKYRGHFSKKNISAWDKKKFFN
jgi:hypothetical protein